MRTEDLNRYLANTLGPDRKKIRKIWHRGMQVYASRSIPIWFDTETEQSNPLDEEGYGRDIQSFLS